MSWPQVGRVILRVTHGSTHINPSLRQPINIGYKVVNRVVNRVVHKVFD